MAKKPFDPMEYPFEFRCQNCDGIVRMSVNERTRGVAVRCPQCGEQFDFDAYRIKLRGEAIAILEKNKKILADALTTAKKSK